MRKLLLLVLVVLLIVPWRPAPIASAQEPARDVVYSRFSVFQIPYHTDARDNRIDQLQLFVSTDQGRTWQASNVATPDKHFFRFEAEADGLYWFTVRTRDRSGRYYPATLEGAKPSLKVIVDTHPPEVRLQALPARGGEIGVAWTITDENLEVGSLRLDYRTANGVSWRPLRVDPYATQYFFNPGTQAPIVVRLRTRDRAENWGEGKITLDGRGQGGGGDLNPERQAPRRTPRPEGIVRMVNSKEFTLSYNVKDVGRSNLSVVDIWYTQDGNNWQKYRRQRCSEAGNGQPPYSVTLKVAEEGLYGFTLVVHSGVGFSIAPPQVGDKPQVWVEVDVTKPDVQLGAITVGQGRDEGKLTVTWRARDKNLAAQSITLSYADKPDGPWTPFAEKLENTGRYVWQMPSDLPYEFLVRAEAMDKAGNVGTAITAEKVKVDLAKPKAEIIGVQPIGK
jgi:hypothetical protein